MHDFIRAWRDYAPKKPPYVLPEDEDALDRTSDKVVHGGMKAYLESGDIDRKSDRRLHLGLLPQPFHGPIETAKVFVLLLNPGVDPVDYLAEYEHPEFRSALCERYKTINQPFLFLDDRFAWHSGFRWWFGKLSEVIREIARHHAIDHTEARRRVANKIAAVDLVPYHSPQFGARGLQLKNLRSTQLARAFLEEVVIPRAAKNECGVVITRKVREWSLAPSENVVIYSLKESQGAGLGPKTPGGKLILRMLSSPR